MVLLQRNDERGDPNATKNPTARMIFKLAKLSKKDIFYDLGCGHGSVCIWAAQICKLARGIESSLEFVDEAKWKVEKCGMTNVEIIHGDFEKRRFTDADVLYCIRELDLSNFEAWSRRKKKRNLRIVTLGPPPVPIKPTATRRAYCLTSFPYERAKSVDEWYRAVLGTNHMSWKELRKKYKIDLSREALQYLKDDLCKEYRNKFKNEARRSLKQDLKRYFG